MKKVAVIGGGIFGVSAALELSKYFDVALYERDNKLLSGASTNNHLRYHYGYHYPRSKKTAIESLEAHESFKKAYGDCVSEPFSAYYAISKENTKTSSEEFLKFCDELNLPYTIEFPDEIFIDRSKVNLCVKVPEPVYNPSKLLELVWAKLRKSTVKVNLNHEIVGGKLLQEVKRLKIKFGNDIVEEDFDYVISAIYCNFNMLNNWFNFSRKKVLYELVELLEIKLPFKDKIGLTILDGEFSSVLPRGEKETYTLGHVKESVLKERISDNLDPALMISENINSNKEKILAKGFEDFPIIKKAKFVKSIFITRVVKANVDDSDERPTEITHHGHGIYSIFGGKVVTCIDSANKIREKIIKTY